MRHRLFSLLISALRVLFLGQEEERTKRGGECVGCLAGILSWLVGASCALRVGLCVISAGGAGARGAQRSSEPGGEPRCLGDSAHQ